MEKSEITSLDLRFLVKELRTLLLNGFVRKIYQYEYTLEKKKTNQFMFEIFVPGKGAHWLYFDKRKMFITTYKKPSPMTPPNFCLFLRKHMNNSKIIEIRQHEFDRIIEIRTSKNIMIVELFSDGNVILCDDQYNIIMPLYVQRWKDRAVKPKIQYKYPPAKINPFAVNFDYFREFLSKFDKKIIAVLASGFGLGPDYAREVCTISNIPEDTISERLGINLSIAIFNNIRNIDNFSVSPTIYEGFVSPFPLQSMSESSIKKQTALFSESLDEFFSEQQIQVVEKEEVKVVEEHKEKIEKIIEHQEKSLEKWEDKKVEKRTKADIIYSHYGTVESVIEALNKAKTSGLSWNEIKSRASSEDTPEAGAIKEIKEHEGTVVLQLGEEEVEIDFTKSVEENAADYYEGSKQAKRKIEGVQVAMEETTQKLEEVPEITELAKPVKVVKKRQKWFEKFRWFNSSDDFMIVGGKDATSNEVLVRKHTEPNDMVFHSDIHGSPFVVIKSSGETEITDYARKEAAEFCAAYSKAWTTGLATVDVYGVKPDQVSKQPPTGEYLPKGSFMIYGQREWFRDVELKVSIGVKISREEETVEVISGPVMALRKHAKYFVTIKPGDTSGADLAREIKNKILIKATPEDKIVIEKLPIDEFQRFIPGGKGEVIEYGV
ncbi:MAG: NFACT family protein [Candidatus Aenigmarchaeota archaeon]|nr:NFACT family protein [Candidatus Aenigmarchaeota archaeon]